MLDSVETRNTVNEEKEIEISYEPSHSPESSVNIKFNTLRFTKIEENIENHVRTLLQYRSEVIDLFGKPLSEYCDLFHEVSKITERLKNLYLSGDRKS